MTANVILATLVISLPPFPFFDFRMFSVWKTPHLCKKLRIPGFSPYVENGKEIGQDCLGKRLGLKGKERFQAKKSTWVPIRLLSARANDI